MEQHDNPYQRAKIQAEQLGLRGSEKRAFISEKYLQWKNSADGIAELQARQTQKSEFSDATHEQIVALRKKVCARLRASGFRCFRRARKTSASTYYTDGKRTVRISDHALPSTPEREWKRADGCVEKWSNVLLCFERRDGSLRTARWDEIDASLKVITDE
jgi:hypothetical protein